MNIVPFREKQTPTWELMDQIEKTFFQDPFFSVGKQKKIPKVNVKEYKDKYVVQAFVPQYPKENIDISIDNGCLVLKGEKTEENDKSYIHKEITGKSFLRTIPFEKQIEHNRINAELDNGILHIQVPKSNNDETKKKIKIK